ncbi:MAG: hypothetical protein ACYC3V_03175 [Chloroflexota bacterium]
MAPPGAKGRGRRAGKVQREVSVAESVATGSPVAAALLRLDRWLDTMRGPEGYGGPVAHWWQNCFLFTGAGLDWRYEGIVTGYLSLYEKTGDERWLAKARRAADDLVAGQTPEGSYAHSEFELNPGTGGTPHEAACDLALLQLAAALRERGEPEADRYLAAARRNLVGYYVGRLWDEEGRLFRDNPATRSFVPNKAATLVEALLLLVRLTSAEGLVESYVLPTLDAIVRHQVRGGRLDGALDQYSQEGRPSGRFFPFYAARCVPALVAGYSWSSRESYLDAARRAMDFVLRYREEDGGFPQVLYANGRVNRYPRWVAGSAEVARAMLRLSAHGYTADPAPILSRLLAGQGPTGAFRTAEGFASQLSQRQPSGPPDFRDLLPVCGWNDKPFRLLAETVDPAAAPRCPGEVDPRRGGVHESDCLLRGRVISYREEDEKIELREGRTLLYRWHKGASWARAWSPELLWK